MRYKPEQYDGIITKLGTENPNMLVPWYLMASYAYYDLDTPFLTDKCYDWLCRELDTQWGDIEHRHKDLIGRENLAAGTAYSLAGNFPEIIKGAAEHLMKAYDKDSAPPKPCDYCAGTGWFYSMEDLGPCGCPKGAARSLESIGDLL